MQAYPPPGVRTRNGEAKRDTGLRNEFRRVRVPVHAEWLEAEVQIRRVQALPAPRPPGRLYRRSNESPFTRGQVFVEVLQTANHIGFAVVRRNIDEPSPTGGDMILKIGSDLRTVHHDVYSTRA